MLSLLLLAVTLLVFYFLTYRFRERKLPPAIFVYAKLPEITGRTTLHRVRQKVYRCTSGCLALENTATIDRVLSTVASHTGRESS